MGQKLAQHLGFKLIADPYVIQLDTRRVALTHGDLLCSDDNEYLEFRQKVRNKNWQQEFLSQPLHKRQLIAANLRADSQKAMKKKSDEIMDVNQQTVLKTFQTLRVDTLIHGHTHRPGYHDISPGLQRLVLGDWNPEPSYISWQHGELTLTDNRIG